MHHMPDLIQPRKCYKSPQQEKCRPRQRQYFHCPYTSLSGGKASRIHCSTNFRVFILSQLRRRRQCAVLSFLPQGVHDIFPVKIYSQLNNAPVFPSRYSVVHSVYIYILNDTFWWYFSTYGTHCLFDITCHSLDFYSLYYVYVFILSFSRPYSSFYKKLWSSQYILFLRLFLHTVCPFFFPFW